MEQYLIKFSGNFGYNEIIVVGKKSKEKLIKELNEKYNKNKINVTFTIEEIESRK